MCRLLSKLMFAGFICFAFAPLGSAQSTRFTGSYTPATAENLTLTLREVSTGGFSSTTSISAAMRATWNFDVTTDGQSMTLNNLSASFVGTVRPAENPFVSVDLSFTATATGTYDINPIGKFTWDISPYTLSAQVSGTYHSFDHAQPFSFTDAGGSGFETAFSFVGWPRQLVLLEPSFNTDQTSFGPPTQILVEPFLQLSSLTLTHPTDVVLMATPLALGCPCCDCGDFDHDSDTDGADFLVWQQQLGAVSAGQIEGDGNGDGAVNASDLELWRSHFGESHNAVATVPEATALTMGLCAAAALLCNARSARAEGRILARAISIPRSEGSASFMLPPGVATSPLAAR